MAEGDVDAMLDLDEDSVPCVESGSELAWCDEEERHDVLYEMEEDYNIIQDNSDIEFSKGM